MYEFIPAVQKYFYEGKMKGKRVPPKWSYIATRANASSAPLP
jgi:hypothetical protein